MVAELVPNIRAAQLEHSLKLLAALSAVNGTRCVSLIANVYNVSIILRIYILLTRTRIQNNKADIFTTGHYRVQEK